MNLHVGLHLVYLSIPSSCSAPGTRQGLAEHQLHEWLNLWGVWSLPIPTSAQEETPETQQQLLGSKRAFIPQMFTL